MFSLSVRDIELMLAERGVVISHESVRHWCLRFGAEFAVRLYKRRPKLGDTWHMDEVYSKNNSVPFYLCRVVDQNGGVLDHLVQERRSATADKRLFKRLIVDRKYKARKIVTDGFRSARSCAACGPARRAALRGVRHWTSRFLNNRAENSPRLTRRRQQQIQRFSSAEHARCFLSARAMVYGHFRPLRHLMTAG